jgi:predicted metal-dependent hydrolase
MATRTVDIPDIGTVTLYKRRGNRSLRLSLGANGEIRVSLPSWVPYKAGEQFARGKTDWILAHRKTTTDGLQHGQAIGKAHRLQFVSSALSSKVSSRLRQNQIEITHPHTLAPSHPNVQSVAQSASIRALRKEAELLLPQRLQALAAQTAFSYRSVGVNSSKAAGEAVAPSKILCSIFF